MDSSVSILHLPDPRLGIRPTEFTSMGKRSGHDIKVFISLPFVPIILDICVLTGLFIHIST